MGYPSKAERRERRAHQEVRSERADFDHADREANRQHVPTSGVYRMVGTGATGHTGAEVAMLFATGQVAMDGPRRRRRPRDAAGPLKADVGLTTQRGGGLDYNRQRSSRFETAPHPATVAKSYAAKIDAYTTRTQTI